MKPIDNFLNSITMYRLVLYSLLVLAAVALLYSILGLLPFSPLSLGLTWAILLTVCFLTHHLLILIFKAPTNSESYLITSLILFFILVPIQNIQDGWVTILAAVMAMASRYLVAIHRKHLFNPAAFAVLVIGLLSFGNAFWWVGSGVLLPFTAVIGFLIVRKIRRAYLFGAFAVMAVVTLTLFNLVNKVDYLDLLGSTLLSGPLVFFGTVMLTEPMTTPPTRKLQMIYGALVGLLFGSQFSFGPVHSSPELALVLGNVFAYLVSPKQGLLLNLKERITLAPNLYEFVFSKNTDFAFTPGQYLEWTLPPERSDGRGNRRYFTVASSPTEEDIRLGIKVPPSTPSSFKSHLLNLPKEAIITASQLSGDFVLPESENQKLVFIAGGIGVTPYRSIVKYLLDTGKKRDIVMFYASVDPREFVYQSIFKEAEEKVGLKTVYVITEGKNAPEGWSGEVGFLNAPIVQRHVPDFKDRLFYISGPNAMVTSYKKLLSGMGVSRRQIITDYFPGY